MITDGSYHENFSLSLPLTLPSIMPASLQFLEHSRRVFHCRGHWNCFRSLECFSSDISMARFSVSFRHLLVCHFSVKPTLITLLNTATNKPLQSPSPALQFLLGTYPFQHPMSSVDLLHLLFIVCPSTVAQQRVCVLLISILQAIENSVWHRAGTQGIFLENDIIFLKVKLSTFT